MRRRCPRRGQLGKATGISEKLRGKEARGGSVIENLGLTQNPFAPIPEGNTKKKKKAKAPVNGRWRQQRAQHGHRRKQREIDGLPSRREAARPASTGWTRRSSSARSSRSPASKPHIGSPAGAQGIAQIMPATARGWGVDPNNPRQALDAAAKNMASYVKKYGGYENALRAYNAGPGAIQASQGLLGDEQLRQDDPRRQGPRQAQPARRGGRRWRRWSARSRAGAPRASTRPSRAPRACRTRRRAGSSSRRSWRTRTQTSWTSRSG